MHEFIDVAKKHGHGGFFRYPCQLCKNEKDYSSTGTIHSHLFHIGFMPNYNVWTEHGERGIILENDQEEEESILDFADDYSAFFKDTTMGEPEEPEGHVVEDDFGQMLCEAEVVLIVGSSL